MGLLELMGGAGEQRRGKGVQDGQPEDDAGRQQEAILTDGLRELRPEVGRRGHAPTQTRRLGLGNLDRRLSFGGLVRTGSAQGADKVDLRGDPFETDFRHRGQ